MSKKALMTFGAIAMCVLLGRPAFAHPHLWIDVSATVLFDQNSVIGIRFQWTFDEFFSAGVIGEFDKNHNKQFDANEIEPVRVGAFEGTREVGFFTDILLGMDKFAIDATTDFTAKIEKGMVVYEFTVPLAEPIDPREKSLSLSVYDQSYFVDIAFQGHEPIKLRGSGSAQCSIAIAEDRLNPIYGGIVYPKKAQLQCLKPR